MKVKIIIRIIEVRISPLLERCMIGRSGIFWKIWARAVWLVPERWWTIPE